MTKKRSKPATKKPQWEDMTRAERRVAIAHDVIDRFVAGKVEAKRGSYASVKEEDESLKFSEGHMLTRKDGREILSKCTVCARGALFACRVAKFNNVEKSVLFHGTVSADTTKDGLKDAFDYQELKKIEQAFEGWGEIGSHIDRFSADHPDITDRLLAICQNIVDHGGDFRPSVRYVVN